MDTVAVNAPTEEVDKNVVIERTSPDGQKTELLFPCNSCIDCSKFIVLESKDGYLYKFPVQLLELTETLKHAYDALKESMGDESFPQAVPSFALESVIKWCCHYYSPTVIGGDSASDADSVTPKELKNIYIPENIYKIRESTNITDLPTWDSNFFNVEMEVLYGLINAADYMRIGYNAMLQFGCMVAASRIKGKSPKEVREIFGVPDDLTPEEIEQIKKENEWCEPVDITPDQALSSAAAAASASDNE